MIKHRAIDIIVGLFVLLAIYALFVIAVQASSIHKTTHGQSYMLHAYFDDVGSLMVRAPVRIAGVKIGEVVGVSLDSHVFKAKVTMAISDNENNIPKDSSASIMTEGLLGAKYVSLSPGFDSGFFEDGSIIETTHSALILENLIGKLLFKFSK